MGRKAQRAATRQLQLDLFAQPPTRQEAIKDITWSYSKRGVFERCQRRYYYEYFGSAVAMTAVEPQQAVLHQMKALEGRHERAGSLLHLGIKTYLRRAQQEMPMADSNLVEWLLGLFQRDCEYSRADPDGERPLTVRFPPVLLLEYHYRQPDADRLMAESTEHLREAAQAFLSAPVFAPFRQAGMRPGALIEQHLRLPGLSCKTDGRLDLAYREDGQVTIVDWKSGGNSGDGTDSLQLAAYALWAQDQYQIIPEAIHIYRALLREAAIESFPVTAHLLDQARVRILQDAERMAMAQSYGESGRVEAFTPCGQAGVCRLCPFQRVCPEGSKLLYA